MNKWVLATRPWSLPASIMPALIALAYGFYRQDLFMNYDWIAGIAALIGGAIYQMGGNLVSDYYDYKHGVDTHDNLGATNLTILDNILSDKTVLRFGFILLFIGIAIGLWLTYRCGTTILYIGLLGTFLAFLYFPFKSCALGDLHILICFGTLIPLGTMYALTGVFYPIILLISLPAGFLIVNILHANNTRDRRTDNRAGIKTIAMLLGLRASKIYYTLLTFLAFTLIILDIIFGLLPIWALIVFIALPMAIKNVKLMLNCQEMTDIAALDGSSAQLVALFSLMIVISCFVTPLLKYIFV